MVVEKPKRYMLRSSASTGFRATATNIKICDEVKVQGISFVKESKKRIMTNFSKNLSIRFSQNF